MSLNKFSQELIPEELELVKQMQRRKCSICGRRFTPVAKTQKYCSKFCKDKAREERYGRTTISF